MEKLEFQQIFGYQEIKDELNQIKKWYEDPDILGNPDITLPKGILLYGNPGNGKTLFVREFINNFDCPKFIIEGRNRDTALEIKNVFKKAKKEKFAIVVIDELELLIQRDTKEQRMLQQELDGIDQKGSVLVLATANNINRVGDPLLRPGRFDKLMEIGQPDKASRKSIFENMLKKIGVDVKNINFDYICAHCQGISGADIKAICNDAYLRCNSKKITDEEIEKSYDRVKYKTVTKNPLVYKDYRVAVHEAGHSIMAIHFKENWSLYKTKFEENGGITQTEEVNEKEMTFDKKIEQILIGFGGYIAEKLIFGHKDYGAEMDYTKIHIYCENLVTNSCFYGIKYHALSTKHCECMKESALKKYAIERKTHSLMKKYEKETTSFLRSNIDKVKKFADLMMEQGYVSYRDLEKNNLARI